MESCVTTIGIDGPNAFRTRRTISHRLADILDHHRAVKRQEYAVELRRGLQARDQPLGESLECFFRQRAFRDRRSDVGRIDVEVLAIRDFR